MMRVFKTRHFQRWMRKSGLTDISDSELDALQSLTADLLARTSGQLDLAVADGTLQEICHGDKS
ncbi:hypothetical protein [Burkholderia gladioli]|uniref:hypothetical protein n=1 Tax=Burkholderia gladioli TaxID=28095 RepID=UPI002FE30566